MVVEGRFQRTRRDLATRRESYFLRILGLAAALFLIAAGLWLDQPGLLVFGLALFVLALLLLGAQLWVVHRLYDTGGVDTSKAIYRMSQTRPTDKLLSVDLGIHDSALIVARSLTSGRLHVVDVYNPQMVPHAWLARVRRRRLHTPLDPRISWYSGSVNLLPLPDHSVRAVFLDQVLSDLVQEGDRHALLQEVRRVLEPNGRLLIAELADSWPNRLRIGPGGVQVEPAAYWTELLTAAGLQLTKQTELDGLMLCLRADKISPYAGRQLTLGLAFESGA